MSVVGRMGRAFLSSLALATGLLSTAPVQADEAAVRNASRTLVEAWNRHDVKAWTALLAEDVWYTETNDSLYQRMKGRDRAVSLMSYAIENSDLQWDIVRMKTLPDGQVSVVLVQRVLNLPKTGDQYRSVFKSDPALARWRRDADGRWRLVFFTSHEGWALAEIKKEDEGSPVASAPAAPASAPARSAAPPRGTVGSEPKEYTSFWGRFNQGCNYCHGRPPALPSSEVASRIVAVGAATRNGAELRTAMQHEKLGGTMDHIVADPQLDDAALEALRRYLVDVRDGELPAQVAFETAGATREVQVRNERSARDAPARIALLRVTGPFSVDAGRSTCRRGAVVAGGATCRVALRAAANARPAATGALEFQFAPTKGLEPGVRRAQLQIGG
jgi:ketosteroid isomerase-like protein